MIVLGPTSDFPTCGSGKGTGDPQRIWLWRIVGFDYRVSTRWWNIDTWRAQTKPCVHKDPGKTRRDLQGTEPDLPVSLWVPCGREGWHWPALGTRAVAGAVLGGTCWHKFFWRAPWSPQAKQLTERECTPSAESWIKGLLSMALPLGQGQASQNQSAGTSLLCPPIREQKEEARATVPQPPEWKPQPQKANKNDHMDHSLV